MSKCGCCIATRKDNIADRFAFERKFYAERDEWINTGDSAIVHPSDNLMIDPVSKRKDLLYAEVDTRQIKELRRVLDVAGHYVRRAVFELIVHTAPRPIVTSASTSIEPSATPESTD